MKLVLETDAVSVTISDQEGYSPDKLDDWVTRAATLVAVRDLAERQG